ncbi:MAG: cupredoxin domain-containing protein [Acidimicrobiia bacterium]
MAPAEPLQSRYWIRRLAHIVLAGVAATVLLSACGGSDSNDSQSASAAAATTASTSPTTAPAATAQAAAGAVTVKQFQFMPNELTVKAGTRVTWTNQDQILHTATSGATPGTSDGNFDGPMDGPGQSFTFTFDQRGTYPYFCSRHNSMTGKIVVQ